MFRKTATETSIDFIKLELKQQREADLKRDDTFAKHIEHEEGKLDKIDAKLAELAEHLHSCPESEHIKEQNGKLARLTTEVAETRGTVKIWCYIFAALIFASTAGTIISNYAFKK